MTRDGLKTLGRVRQGVEPTCVIDLCHFGAPHWAGDFQNGDWPELFDLDRNLRPVGRAYQTLITQWGHQPLLPRGPLTLTGRFEKDGGAAAA